MTELKRKRSAGHVACMGGGGRVYRGGLLGKPEGKRPLGKFWLKWNENIKTDLQEVVYVGMDWIELAQDRDRCWALVNAVIIFQVQ